MTITLSWAGIALIILALAILICVGLGIWLVGRLSKMIKEG